MNKRTFLKTSSALVAGGIISPMMSCNSSKSLSNWSGNLTYHSKKVHYPTSLQQVVDIVQKQNSAKGLGSRHSFNTIADTNEHQISLKKMNKILALDKTAKTVTVEAGTRYGDICEYLDQNGFALHNLASLPHISIAGACATATHGSGVKNGALATSIQSIELVKANGEVVEISKEKDRDTFNGAIVGLGALGIVTKLTLSLQPAFRMQQTVYRNLPMSALETHFEEIMSSGYSVSLFTDWQNKNVNQVWIKSRSGTGSIVSGDEYFDATLATRHMHPLDDHPAENCTEQMGTDGPWYERLPHFKMGFTPSSGDELQAEFFVPMEYGYEAMTEVEKLQDEVFPHLFISEIRTIAADQFWMSPFYNKPCVAIHFTWKPHWEAVQGLLPKIEEALAPYHVRPHWGKLFTLDPSVLQGRIEKLEDFKALVKAYDPEGKFRNPFLNHNLGYTSG